jgi:hypothetical protein
MFIEPLILFAVLMLLWTREMCQPETENPTPDPDKAAIDAMVKAIAQRLKP